MRHNFQVNDSVKITDPRSSYCNRHGVVNRILSTGMIEVRIAPDDLRGKKPLTWLFKPSQLSDRSAIC